MTEAKKKNDLCYNRIATWDKRDDEYYATHGPIGDSWKRANAQLISSMNQENKRVWDISYDLNSAKGMKLSIHLEDYVDIPFEQLDWAFKSIVHEDSKMCEEERDKIMEQAEQSLAEYEFEQKESPYKRLCEWIDEWSTEDRMLLAYELRYELESNGLNDLHSRYGKAVALNYYDPPDKVNSFDDAIQLIRKTKGNEFADDVMKYGKWRIMSIKHRLYSLYISGTFKGCIQIK